MSIAYSLEQDLREKLSQPFGILITGSPEEALRELKSLVNRKNPAKIISVGDMVSRNLHEHNMVPQVAITDNKCMRKEIRKKIFPGKSVIRVTNPQGTITQEAITAIRESLTSPKEVQIVVEGEEDLLALIVIQYAPENTLVVYGQPNQGIVAVEVTPEKKAETEAILKAMKTVRKAK